MNLVSRNQQPDCFIEFAGLATIYPSQTLANPVNTIVCAAWGDNVGKIRD